MTAQQTNVACCIDKSGFKQKLNQLTKLVKSAESINAIQIGLRKQILDAYDAEMATVYFVGGEKKELISWLLLPGGHLKAIRIPINRNSIAGFVAQTRQTINVRDVTVSHELQKIDNNLSYDSSWDKKTGFATKQMLVVPILFNNSLLGVSQLINKKNGEQFTSADERLFTALSENLGNAFYRLQKKSILPPSRFDFLAKNGVVSKKDLIRAENIALQQGKDVEIVLINDFEIPKDTLGNTLANHYGTVFEDLSVANYDPKSLLKSGNLDFFKKNHCVPLTKNGAKTIVAINDFQNRKKAQEVMQALKTSDVEFRLAFKQDIDLFIERHRPLSRPKKKKETKCFRDIIEEMERLDGSVVEQPETINSVESENFHDSVIVRLVFEIIEHAHRMKASDVHIEPYGIERDAEVRFRIDGHCTKILTIPKNHIKEVISRLKILANLDISERRKPQDGKIRFKTTAGKEIELRIATIPTADRNEDIVMRLLADSEPLPLEKIMPQNVYDKFCKIIEKPYGIILVAGPTGSGKTTTLHSALGHINTPEKKIWTAEDPVEITQYRLRQVQVNPKIGLTFASAMRAFLRADPDVIMVGEMRDNDTAKMGIEASLTGHLVLSTLHTNSAPETITRLIDMGIDTFNFADALRGILAQRLVGILCPECKISYHPDQAEYDRINQMYGDTFDEIIQTPYSSELCFYKPVGCESCNNTGYKGRMGLYELLVSSETLRKMVIDGARVDEIRALAQKEGMTTLLQEGIRNVFLGHTDLKQVVSVCSY